MLTEGGDATPLVAEVPVTILDGHDVDALIATLRKPVEGTAQVHLNNAGVAPMTAAAREAGANALDHMLDGSLGVPALLDGLDAARATFGRLVGAAKEDVAFFSTCAAAISQVALGLPLAAGDEIVVPDQEYPSNAYPWWRAAERTGARVVQIASRGSSLALATEDVLAAIGERTRVVALSTVQYQSGATLDLRSIADAVHARAGVLVVDAIQGLGVVPFDQHAAGADYVCGGTHKWLLGPVGLGFLVASRARRAALDPLLHGAMTYGTPDDAVDPTRPPRVDARRFEPGTPPALLAMTGAASVELLLRIGVERIQAEALALAERVRREAEARGLEVRCGGGPSKSPIVVVVPRGDPRRHVDALRTQGISVAWRAGGIRVSPHIHNGPQHIDRFFEALDALERGPKP